MVSTTIEKRKFTYEDYLKTPDEERYELIGGELLMTPAPVPKHQRISRKIEFLLEKFVTENDLGEVFDAPCDVHLDDENVVQPDILFIAKNRMNIIGEKNVQGAPDLTIEILSKSTAYRDLIQKKKLYSKFGVKEFWIVIPDEEAIEVYILKDSAYLLDRSYSKNETLESQFLTGFKIELNGIF